jgi:glutathione S-transferase
MLIVHHLNNSRSQRILWMLEELQVPYQIVRYQRESTMLAPASLKAVHPLGKSPVVEDNGNILAESGAIIEYLQETYDPESRLKPISNEEKLRYRFWLHYAEGSLMPLLMMKLVFGRLGKAPVPWLLRPVGNLLGQGVQKAYLNKQISTHARYLEDSLQKNPWFAGQSFSAADIQMSFPVVALLARGGNNDLPNLQNWFNKVQQRPAWQRAIQQGGPFDIPGA